MSKPFVKFVDGKLNLVAELDADLMRNARVVSILGKARMGKSTFLNTIISRITGQNMDIFKAQNTYEHCTKGIDYYYLPSHNILLLDSQGLDSQDSSHEPALLLFVYLVSDLIIFNEIRMLQNGALKLMEPICTFMTYVDLEEITKPKLTFRIADSSTLSGTPAENIKMIIDTVYDDQYQSIRESIRHLFNTEINLVKTDNLDKKSAKMLEENDYIRLLTEGDCGFQEAIDEVIASLPDTDRGPINYMLKIPQIIEQINNNEKIKIEKLDIVGMTVRDEINTWKESLELHLFSTIEVDGTQACYDEKVEPRKMMKKATLTAFTKKFKSVPDKIREPEKVRLGARLGAPIHSAEEQSIAKAEERVKNFVELAQEDKTFPTISSEYQSFSSWTQDGFDSYLSVFRQLDKAIEPIYKPVKEKYTKWCEKVYEKFFDGFNRVIAIEQKQKLEALKICDAVIAEFIGKTSELISFIEVFDERTSILIVKDSEILTKWASEKREDLRTNRLHSVNVRYQLSVQMKDRFLSTTLTELDNNPYLSTAVVTYDLVKDVYEGFCDTVYKLCNNKDSILVSELVDRKKELLYNKFIRQGAPMTHLIIQNNPGITFVYDPILAGAMITGTVPWMTEETYNDIYIPIMNKAKSNMITKGYCKEDNDFGIVVNQSLESGNNIISKSIGSSLDKIEENQLAIFIRILQKLYCQEVVSGTKFSENLEY